MKIVHGYTWDADFDVGRLIHLSRQSLKYQEFKGMAALLRKEARNCGCLFIDLNGRYFSDLDFDASKASGEEVLQSLSESLGLPKEQSTKRSGALRFAIRSVNARVRFARRLTG